MKSFGLRSRIRRTLLIVIATITSLTSHVTAKPEIQKPVQLETIIELLSATIKDFASLNYYTAKKIEIAVPGVNQSITANWEFSGSGYLFSALPTVPIKIETTSSDTQKNKLTILSDTLIKYAALKTKDEISFLKWISDVKLSPVKLFCLKLLLLSKYAYNKNNIDVFRTELFRLLFRLSLTNELGIDTNKPLSSILPKVIADYIKTIFPQGLDLIDSLWDAFTSDSAFDIDAIADTKMLQTFVFNDEKIATKCFAELTKQLQNSNNTANFTAETTSYLARQGYDIISYKDFTRLNAPKPKKQAWLDNLLKDACKQKEANTLLKTLNSSLTHIAHKAFSSTSRHLPAALKNLDISEKLSLVAGENCWWIVYPSNDLGITTTLSCISKSLMNICKQYATARQNYFKKHPSEVKQLQTEYENKQREQCRVELFLKTEEGIESQQRISDQLRQLNSEKKTSKTHVDPKETQEITELSDEVKDMQKNLEMFQDLLGSNTDSTLMQIIESLTTELDEKQTALRQLTQKTNNSHNKVQQRLDDLLRVMQQVKEDEGDVPAFLQKNVDLLKHELKQHAENNKPHVSLQERLQSRAQEATIYKHEAKTIEKLRDAKLDQINKVTNLSERKIELVKFKALKESKYNAYIADLKKKATKLLEENKKIQELDVYRTISSNDNADIDETQKARQQQLELEVGHLLDGNTEQSFVGSLLGSDAEVKQLVMDLLKPEYKKLKDQLFDTLTHVISRCKHFKDPENKILYEGLIQIFAPELLSIFKKLTTTV